MQDGGDVFALAFSLGTSVMEAVGALTGLVGLIAYPHPLAPACETVSTCRATSTVPMRAPALLAATLRPIVPSPLPTGLEVIVIHGTLLVALQEQPPPAVTPTA